MAKRKSNKRLPLTYYWQILVLNWRLFLPLFLILAGIVGFFLWPASEAQTTEPTSYTKDVKRFTSVCTEKNDVMICVPE